MAKKTFEKFELEPKGRTLRGEAKEQRIADERPFGEFEAEVKKRMLRDEAEEQRIADERPFKVFEAEVREHVLRAGNALAGAPDLEDRRNVCKGLKIPGCAANELTAHYCAAWQAAQAHDRDLMKAVAKEAKRLYPVQYFRRRHVPKVLRAMADTLEEERTAWR